MTEKRWALATGVRFSAMHLREPTERTVPQRLKPSNTRQIVARLKPCPSGKCFSASCLDLVASTQTVRDFFRSLFSRAVNDTAIPSFRVCGELYAESRRDG